MHAEIESPRHGGYALVRCDDAKDGRIPPGFPVLRSKSLQAARRYQHLFVLCSALHLPEAAKFIIEMNREHRLQALFVRTDVDPALLPQMLERAGLRFFRNMLVHSDSLLPRRVLTAWLRNAQAELIAHATVADDRLIVVSCEPKTYEVRFDQMPALRKIAPEQRRNFESQRTAASYGGHQRISISTWMLSERLPILRGVNGPSVCGEPMGANTAQLSPRSVKSMALDRPTYPVSRNASSGESKKAAPCRSARWNSWLRPME